MESKTVSNQSRHEGSLLLSPEMRPALIMVFIWINLSEVFRYFAFVMPMMRSAMPQVTDVAPMNLSVFLIWGIWDTILIACASLVISMYFERHGGGFGNILKAGTLIWASVFSLFWIATWNMNMTPIHIPLLALPLAWLEMVIAAAIIERGWQKWSAVHTP